MFRLSLHLVYQAVCDVTSVHQVKCGRIEIGHKAAAFLAPILSKLGQVDEFYFKSPILNFISMCLLYLFCLGLWMGCRKDRKSVIDSLRGFQRPDK